MANQSPSQPRQNRGGGEIQIDTEEVLKAFIRRRLVIEARRVLGSEIDLNILLNLIASEAMNVMNADRSSIWILDKQKNVLWTGVATGISSRPLEVLVGTGFAGTAALTGETLNIPNASQDKRFNLSVDLTTGYRTQQILSIPMKNTRGDVNGVIQVLMNQRDGLSFVPIDGELLT